MNIIKTMSKETKEKIRSLEQEKILLEDMLEFEQRPVQMVKIEEEIFEIEDTLAKLTAQNIGFQAVDGLVIRVIMNNNKGNDMIYKIEKQILDNLQEIPYPIKRAEFTCGTLYLELDEENQCDLVHQAIRDHYIKNINSAGGVNMWYVGGEFAFDFVPADDEKVGATKQESDLDIALNLEAEMTRGK